MARPQKQGLEYFPLDVDIDQDDKVYLIEAKHGIVGFALFIRLLMKIYKNGYCIKWGDDEAFILSKQTSVDVNVVKNVVNDCINYGLFNQKLYTEYGILTSSGIQKRYFEASARRKEVIAVKEFLLIDPSKYSNIVIVDINGINVDKNEVNVDIMYAINPQSKVKESKVKYINTHQCVGCVENDTLIKIAEIYENFGYGTITKGVADTLLSLVNEFSFEWVKEALHEGMLQNKRSLKYVQAILDRWRAEGGIDRSFKKEKDKQDESKSVYDNLW
jgi:DnaD/phage-associated family protein